jgi:phytoene dehydrogenase-like protein
MTYGRNRAVVFAILGGILAGVAASIIRPHKQALRQHPAVTPPPHLIPVAKNKGPAPGVPPEIARMQEVVDNSFQADAAERAKYFGGYRELSLAKRSAFKNASYIEAEKRLAAARSRFEQSRSKEDRLRFFEEWSRERQYTFELLKVAALNSNTPPVDATPSSNTGPADNASHLPRKIIHQ